jgi:hypothetical protein
MTERRNTLVCAFDPASPRITANDIHEWIYDTLRLPDSDVFMIQIDGIRRQVYIKMTTKENVQAILLVTGGQTQYKYPTGQLATLILDIAGLGTKCIRMANLLPETTQEEIRSSLAPYGNIIKIETEQWFKHYRYAVDNGVRQVTIILNKHVPSHLTVAGYRVLLSYEGQPATCYGCGEVGHVYQGCPVRQKSSQSRIGQTQQT